MKKLLALFIATFLLQLSLVAQNVSLQSEYSKAQLLMAEKKYDDAIAILKKLETSEELAPKRHFIFFQIANCYYGKKDTDKAILYAEKSVDQEPGFDKPYLLLFDLYNTKSDYAEATYVLHSLSEIQPQVFDYQYTLGVMYAKYIDNKNLAIYCFEQVVDASKKMSIPSQYLENSFLYLSNLYYAQERYVDAIEALQKSVAYNPKNNLRFYNTANYFIQKGMLNEATLSVRYFVDNLTEEQQKSAYMYRVFAFLGRMYFLQEKSEATRYLRIGAQDTTYDGKVCRALFNMQIGNYDEAEAQLKEMIESNKGYISPQFAYAKLMEMKGETQIAYDYYIATALMLYNSRMNKTAIKALHYALDLKPGIKKAHDLLAHLYEDEGKISTAIYHYKKSDPDYQEIDLVIHLAYLYHSEKRNDSAQKMLKIAHKAKPDHARAFFFDGIVLADQNQHAEAIDNFEEAIRLEPSVPEYYFYKALSEEHLERDDAAIDSLKTAIEMDSMNSNYLNFLGYMYADKNIHLDQSQALLLKALEAEPFNGAYLDSIGWLYFRKGMYNKSVKYLTRAYRNLEAQQQYDSVVYDHLGDTYIKLEKREKALKFWEKALEHDANNTKIKAKIDVLKADN